ncbi:MAG: hypothetical protein MJE66_00035 [Proteobacteria bacterium]|nr:hypothetical protein [Pseudomonadota bacterium]
MRIRVAAWLLGAVSLCLAGAALADEEAPAPASAPAAGWTTEAPRFVRVSEHKPAPYPTRVTVRMGVEQIDPAAWLRRYGAVETAPR